MKTPAKLAVLTGLYLSQGLPYGFFTQALPVLLRKQDYSLTKIGLMSLLALPWALKFLWAPAVDRWHLPGIGRRKSWILPLQILAILTLVVLAGKLSTASAVFLMGAFLILNLLSATQDIATDGLAVDILSFRERGFANGVQVAGYRVGMIIAGGVLLIQHERLGWEGTFLAMAALIALASVPVILASEPPFTAKAESVRVRTAHFLLRPGAMRLILLVAAYKAGEWFATGMLRPFLVDAGLSLKQIGWLLGTVGFVAGLAGALLGGALVNRFSRRNALLAFGLLQAAAIAGYAYLALVSPDPVTLYVICGVEHFAGGMATAALFTCMMDWCSKETSATDYTVMASAVVIASLASASVSGFSADAFGYLAHFILATVVALGAVGVVFRWFPTAKPA